jgi:hypothetical protein
MAKTLLMLRKYWFVPVIGLLIINSWVAFYRLMGPGKKYMAYERISEFASNLRVQEQTAELEKSLKPGTHDYFNRYRVILLSLNAPSIESIALDDSVFALFHPRFHYYLNTLLYSDQASWNRFKLGDLTDAEFHQLISHFQSGWQRLFFWSERYKTTQDIYARYGQCCKSLRSRLTCITATSPDSTLVVSYRATSMKNKLQLGGIPAKDIPSSSFLIQSSSTGMAVWIAQLMFLIVACIFLWRAIWIVGRISWLEFLFLATAYFPSNLFTGNLFGESFIGWSATFIVVVHDSFDLADPQSYFQQEDLDLALYYRNCFHLDKQRPGTCDHRILSFAAGFVRCPIGASERFAQKSNGALAVLGFYAIGNVSCYHSWADLGI